MRRFLPLILATVILTGCQTAADGLATGSTSTTVAAQAASAIAGDMAGRLVEQIGGTGKTTLRMKKDQSEFATALEAALKGWGYTVLTDQKTEKDAKPIELAWSIDGVDGQVLAHVSTPSIALGRAYTTTTAGAMPASPLSVMRHD